MAHVIRDKKKLLHRVRRIRGQVEAIERALHAARRQTPRNADPRGGRSMIERLQTDPLATL